MTGYPTVQAVSKPAGYDRVLIDGVDVTFFRGGEIKVPKYLLTEPFAYGPCVIDVPMVDATLETLGAGELSWIREDAPVVFQRVDDPTAATPTVLATDYRGVVAAVNADGRNLSLEVGGQFSGPASMLVRTNPLVRRTKDIGFWVANILNAVHLRGTSRFGPVTGIEAVDAGGGSQLDRASDLCALSQTATGVQRTLMPTTWGGAVWGFDAKDTTTVDLTLFTDDARVVAKLRRDKTETPTTYYGTGITPDGVRWKNARYPSVFAGPAPTFPGNMTVGDIDADTLTGDGVTVLQEKLVAMHYLQVTTSLNYAAYTSATSAAVKELQDDAGLTKTGSVNSATWDALFDTAVTGYSLYDAHIAPLVQDPRVRQFDESANGAIIGLNPLCDPSVKPVERFIDFGPGVTKAQAIAWCRGEYSKLAGDNWFGTLELNGLSGFAGEWGPTDAAFLNDPATGATHIMPQRDIRPGMNAWLPMFQGGILVHVSGVSVDPQSRRVTLTVDTLARDLLDLAALMNRDTEARRNIRREWRVEHRANKQSGAMVSRDEYFGQLDRAISLTGDKWNVFPIILGQRGQVNQVRMITKDPHAEFAIAVFNQKMTPKRLARKIGNPLATAAESWLEKDALSDWFDGQKVILYAAGDGNQPCGYGHRRKYDDNGDRTTATLTGKHVDDASWDYQCDPENPMVAWVAVYPDRDCTLKRGQLFWAQEDDAV